MSSTNDGFGCGESTREESYHLMLLLYKNLTTKELGVR
jgi:hypothetical protein